MPKFIKIILRRVKNYLLLALTFNDFLAFKRGRKSDGRFGVLNLNLRLGDRTAETFFDRHYIYHPAWAARILARTNPEKHIDISSTLTFSTIISAFIQTEFYDYRPADLELDNFKSGKADLLRLPFENNSIKSLSCMHTVEHIGLGRYGDPIDAGGDLKAINELKRVLAPGGSLLFVVPVGRPRIEFNFHRVYSYEMIKDYFSELELKEFSLIREKSGGIIFNAGKEDADGEEYGCGCFWFVK